MCSGADAYCSTGQETTQRKALSPGHTRGCVTGADASQPTPPRPTEGAGMGTEDTLVHTQLAIILVFFQHLVSDWS